MASILDETTSKPVTSAGTYGVISGIRWYHFVVVALLIVYPFTVGSFWTVQIGAQTLILGLIALSLMLLAGYGGMVSLSQLTVAGLAGYMVAILGTAASGLGMGWPPFVVIPLAIIAGTVFATLIGCISVRTSGIYTIMITLAIAVAFYFFVLQNLPVFNAFDGFAGVRPPLLFGMNLRQQNHFYFLSLAAAAFGYLLVLYISRSPFGLALQAIRDNPRRMRALGFNVNLHRIAAHALAGFLASLGGVLLVWLNTQISPGSVGLGPVISILIIAILGGILHPIGPFIGALIFILMENFAMQLIAGDRFNTLIGIVFLLIVLFSPDGVLGLWGKLKAWYRQKNPFVNRRDHEEEEKQW
ncbi:branched-chain amino acid transport system permease protein [Natronocella acetinitrilica]|uniref:Branched-chain amino acid transport system permease protein n=1 Tax=Natronocella acetinitrilica TaxID=414046 RepID=A0AAE3G497_9GAMM|nr:branched-chain amino acid ABC transporter permease [Natronocella acetinitrilica]MCP1674819.1 branched-chain amino acid transport system permease protein [Natronocella acetinitrilica]